METKTTTTEKQERYAEVLIEQEMAGSLGTYQIPFSTAERALSYLFALHMEVPSDRSEASRMIDALKDGGSMTYARSNPEFAQRVLGPIGERFGGKFNAINDAAVERMASLSAEDRVAAQESSSAHRRLVIDPLLSV